MINSALLLADLKKVLASLEADLTIRADDSTTDWGRRLRDEYDRAKAKQRTGLAWIEWRNGEVSQAAVAWIIASVFIRFAEDNGLLTGAELDGRRVAMPWIAAPGDGLERAVENETAFYATSPTMTSRDWLHQAFRTLAALPAGRPLVDPDHSPVWHAPISATASDALLEFFRRTTPDGDLVHDFNDLSLDTRFLGDLYQDLSEYAKKTYALLQTPVFVEEFILDLTLTPAIAEFGLTGLKLIDPTCGSGHFLLGAFDRLVSSWAVTAPNVELGERVQRALDSIHGVDLNPFAVAVARFRLTVAAIKAAGIRTLVAAPAFRYHLAIGDSLLGGQSVQLGFDLGDSDEFEYSSEDLREHAEILAPGQYHVVVGNPPYIAVKDGKLRDRYREKFATAVGKYVLSVPFMEVFWRLAKSSNGSGAGYVGKITSNSFMKREFGKTLIEQFLSGVARPDGVRVDLTHVIDTSGAFIPGHGTPTVILAGRRQRPSSQFVRAVLGVRAEPTQPMDPARGQVWAEIVKHIDDPFFAGSFVSVEDLSRVVLERHPWSLAGGGASELMGVLDAQPGRLASKIRLVGVMGMTNIDDGFLAPPGAFMRRRVESELVRPLVTGEFVRDYEIIPADSTFFPYTTAGLVDVSIGRRGAYRWVWPFRTESWNRATFSRLTYRQEGRSWWEWHQIGIDRIDGPTIALAFVATHNHFVLDRGGKVFNRSAPIIKLSEGATEAQHFEILGLLNSSVAAFWLKQVSYEKGAGSNGLGIADELWEWRYEFTGTKLEKYPLPLVLPQEVARRIDEQAQALATNSPRSAIHGGRSAIAIAKTAWDEARRMMVALQEELDWQVYLAYGLVDESLAPASAEVVPIEPNERPFEVRLARAISKGHFESAWFERHDRAPLTEVPRKGSQAWRELWQARYEAAENGFVKMLEQPEYKRRWAGATWNQLVAEAVVEALLDRLEAPELWHDARGVPLIRSVAQVADEFRRDNAFRELLAIHLGSQDFDLAAELGILLSGEAVPGVAALRYKESGIEKFRAWERTWDLQRAEDRGERVDVPVPPKYSKGDFLKASYWTARGKLDVPKERFISFPGSQLPDDSSELFGWAGWDHGERGQAIARLANELSRSAASAEQVIPLVGALLEIEPWLKQWHDEIDTRSGISPATAVAGITTAVLARLDIGRDQVLDWRPPAATRGRRRTS